MDNICHTLVGAALAESGLKRRTALGSATLMIAANLPDVDVVAVPLGHSLGFRRGITHGVPAVIVLPVVLTIDHAGLAPVARTRRSSRRAPESLLLLSAIGVATHPFLDWMNTYGMRWLMPLDPDMVVRRHPVHHRPLDLARARGWRVAGRAGVRRSWTPSDRIDHAGSRSAGRRRRVHRRHGSRWRIAVRGEVRDALLARGITADTVVVEPVFAAPLQPRVIYLWEGSYQLATCARCVRRDLSEPWLAIPLNAGHPAVAVANRGRRGTRVSFVGAAAVLRDRTGGETRPGSRSADARYTVDGRSSWAVVRIPVVAGVASQVNRPPTSRASAETPGRRACE